MGLCVCRAGSVVRLRWTASVVTSQSSVDWTTGSQILSSERRRRGLLYHLPSRLVCLSVCLSVRVWLLRLVESWSRPVAVLGLVSHTWTWTDSLYFS